MISIVINADTRPGCGNEVNTTGDYGSGSLNGVRSWDFLTDGIVNKHIFFAAHEHEIILYVDEHDALPDEVRAEILDIGRNLNFRLVCKPHQRSAQRWNELLYLEALKLANGEYVAHFDADCAAFRAPESDITLRYIGWLNAGGYKFVCQPTTMPREEHGMYWASSRFFMCRRETLDLAEIEHCILDDGYRSAMYGHCPALEHVLGRMAGPAGVFYPPANWDDYMVFSWARYHRGLLRKLNVLPYESARHYIVNGCGIHGPNDVTSIPFVPSPP